MYTQRLKVEHTADTVLIFTPTSYPAMLSWMETSTGRLVTPAADMTSDMNRRGNQIIPMRKKIRNPPIPYFTTFFFFWPGGWGYFCKNNNKPNITRLLLNLPGESKNNLGGGFLYKDRTFCAPLILFQL